jgi:hypothetical protein
MAGYIYARERSIFTLQDRTLTTTFANGTGLAAQTADLDVRAGGNAADDFLAIFELLCRWATVTGITKNTVVAELYLVPLIDGTNLPDVDLTAGSSAMSLTHFASVFMAAKAPTSATDMRFASGIIPLFPCLYRAYLINRSGQSITVTSGNSWQLRAVSAQQQYS